MNPNKRRYFILMTIKRQNVGDEATRIVAPWSKGRKATKRLVCSLLHIENYLDIDPIHPSGGRDGKKEITCKKANQRFIVAIYFPLKS